MQQYKVAFDSLPWSSPAPGARFKVHREGERQIRLVEFTDEFVEPDWCRKGHVGYVVEGQLEVDFDGNKIVFDPGDGIFIPPGEEHKHMGKALTDVVRMILVEDG